MTFEIPDAPLTPRAARAIAFVHKYCRVPDGEHVGKPLVLDEFQQKFYRCLFGNRKIRRAIWSMARKNAKTVTIATLLLVFLIGPEAKQNSQIVSGAMSRDQAGIVFDQCCRMIRMNDTLSSLVRIVESKKTLIGLPMNVQYKAISAEGKTAHGLSPLVCLVDELGQQTGPRSEFFEALSTSQGAHAEPLMLIISTQAASDSDLLSTIIDDALEDQLRPDSTSLCHLYTAPKDCDIMDRDAWLAANPALGKFRSERDVKELAEQAKRMPSTEASFRNLILNQRVSTNSPYIPREIWQSCLGLSSDKPPIEECTEIYGGLDLSKKTDLTALVLIGLFRGKWYIYPFFWVPEKGILDRAKRDRIPYDLWHKQGHLFTTPGATVDYEFVAKQMEIIFKDINPIAIAFDRWRMDVLKKELERIGLSLPMIGWGQGFKDMSPALDALDDLLYNQKIMQDGNPVMNMCAANSIVVSDPSGNRKLDKMKASGRIDGIVALAMASGAAAKTHDEMENLDDFINSPLIY